jgi:acetate kinase
VLVLNAGSSSLKFALYAGDASTILRGQIDGIGETPILSLAASSERQPDPPYLSGSYEDMLDALLTWLNAQLQGAALDAVGHRIVHGGPLFAEPVRIDKAILDALDALVPLAPLHLPHNLAAIHAIARAQPALPQIGCFDTGFHRTMPAVATRLPIPRAIAGDDMRRYGFHGISYEFIARRLRDIAPDLAAGRVIVAHLGSGASLCAMRDGRSVDTTMGFSTLDGLVMATRPGCLDAGAVLYLMQRRGMAATEIEDLLYHKSGLLGLSGISGDMRELAASTSGEARHAVELFAYRLAGEIGRMAACLGGLDGLVFTAGIGEHDPALRADLCARLAWLGIVPDAAANARARGPDEARLISAASSAVQVWVVPTDEEAMIARHTRAILGAASPA